LASVGLCLYLFFKIISHRIRPRLKSVFFIYRLPCRSRN